MEGAATVAQGTLARSSFGDFRLAVISKRKRARDLGLAPLCLADKNTKAGIEMHWAIRALAIFWMKTAGTTLKQVTGKRQVNLCVNL